MTGFRMRLLPYKTASQSSKALAEALDAKRLILDPDRSRFKPRERDVVINWGNVPQAHRCTLNGCSTALVRATNKLAFFKHFQDKGWLPPFWTDQEEIPDEAYPIVCRTTLTGHSGAGIVIADSVSDLVDAPLYVKYIPKLHEYRVHLGRCGDTVTVIAIQQKKRKLDHVQPNWKIRNHANGFIYAREGVDPPAGVVHVAHDCFDGLGLDFCAVDVIWNDKQQQAYVLEANTAPGLEGQTLDDYVNYFKEIVQCL